MIRPIAQAITTCMIWTATMVIFVKGIFAANYHDRPALQFGAFVAATVAVAAAASTAFVWQSPGDTATPTPAPAKAIAEDEWAQA